MKLTPLIEQQIADLPQTEKCYRHPGELCNLDVGATKARTLANAYVIPCYSGCPECVNEAKAARDRFLIDRGIPARLIAATLDNFQCDTPADHEALTAAREFEKERRGMLFLVGDIGRGKSHLAVGVIRCFKNPRFIRQAQLLRMLRELYRNNEAPDPLELCADADCLCLDELGVSAGGKDETPLLYDVFEQRFSALAPLIVTSNLALPQISDILGPRIIDRVKEALFKCVALTGPSRRRDFKADYFTAKLPTAKKDHRNFY
jgi:DNA replication protein DnaC